MAGTVLMTDPERELLEAAALRRRQLCVAFLHGSARSWRVRRRIWPAALTGLLLVALAIAALAVAAAFARQQEIDGERQSLSRAWEAIFQGSPGELVDTKQSLTGEHLSRRLAG